eukprot:CAMPEP_0172918172 /NCGR_PEP_ID=MMETSP1075-20121228/199651_1 /TAXON_ID=2916 /ORGANISM="Ceratium fusus, Strain PA161109" /LENGTH=66 /DNA_ID=CAMNT_0013777773 /DNA_START=654 /DNA_END=851 /DNA_ORIENTATION=+
MIIAQSGVGSLRAGAQLFLRSATTTTLVGGVFMAPKRVLAEAAIAWKDPRPTRSSSNHSLRPRKNS